MEFLDVSPSRFESIGWLKWRKSRSGFCGRQLDEIETQMSTVKVPMSTILTYYLLRHHELSRLTMVLRFISIPRLASRKSGLLQRYLLVKMAWGSLCLVIPMLGSQIIQNTRDSYIYIYIQNLPSRNLLADFQNLTSTGHDQGRPVTTRRPSSTSQRALYHLLWRIYKSVVLAKRYEEQARCKSRSSENERSKSWAKGGNSHAGKWS